MDYQSAVLKGQFLQDRTRDMYLHGVFFLKITNQKNSHFYLKKKPKQNEKQNNRPKNKQMKPNSPKQKSNLNKQTDPLNFFSVSRARKDR